MLKLYVMKVEFIPEMDSVITGSENGLTWVQILISVSQVVTLGKLLSFSKTQFLHLQNGGKNI